MNNSELLGKVITCTTAKPQVNLRNRPIWEEMEIPEGMGGATPEVDVILLSSCIIYLF